MEATRAPHDGQGGGVNETARIEAFSDGVFAIAITLLVLEIKVPHGIEEGTLGSALLKLWPSYLAFITSFLTIGVMWMNHHRLFTLITRTGEWLLVLNGMLLLGVTVTPFTTALVAEYLGHADATMAALVYNGTFVLIAVVFNVLWRYASYKGRLFDGSADQHVIDGITRQYLFGPLYYLVGAVLALVSVPASLVFNVLLALFFALPGYRLLRGQGKAAMR